MAFGSLQALDDAAVDDDINGEVSVVAFLLALFAEEVDDDDAVVDFKLIIGDIGGGTCFPTNR